MRNYKRKTDRGSASKEDIIAAAKQVTTGSLSLRNAAEAYKVNFMTLHRYIKKMKAAREEGTDESAIHIGYAKPRQLFSKEQEQELTDYMKYSAKIYFGLTTLDAKSLAYEYALANNVNIPEKWHECKKATKDWLISFMKRNPSLSIRTPEPTSLGRMTSFNRHNVSQFFNNLSSLYEQYKFNCQDVWNIDETGVTTVQRPSKIIAMKGAKQVGAATSGERGTLVTVVYAVSASGNSVPPLLIFPRKYFKPHFVADGPPGCIGAANPSGWVTNEEFLMFMEHYVKHVRCSKDHPVLVVLDNHASHMGLNVINFCRENGVVLLSFPPHTSHKLQPLDRSVYGPFKRFYNAASDSWMKSHPGETMVIYSIPSLVKPALQSAATPKNILAGFESTGIWPFNPNIFGEEDYLPSAVTDRPLTITDAENAPANIQEEVPVEDEANSNLESQSAAPSTSTASHVSPQQLRPYPMASQRKKTTKRRKITSAVLTSSPMKAVLEAEEQRRTDAKTKKTKVVDKLNLPKQSATKEAKKSKKMEVPSSSSGSSDEEEDEDCLCLRCLKPWSQSKRGEDWVECMECKRWAHASCAGNDPRYICQNCNSDIDDLDK